jgi:hypothetical protein
MINYKEVRIQSGANIVQKKLNLGLDCAAFIYRFVFICFLSFIFLQLRKKTWLLKFDLNFDHPYSHKEQYHTKSNDYVCIFWLGSFTDFKKNFGNQRRALQLLYQSLLHP